MLEGRGAEDGRNVGRSLIASLPLPAGELTGTSSRTPPCEFPMMPLLAPSELTPPGATSAVSEGLSNQSTRDTMPLAFDCLCPNIQSQITRYEPGVQNLGREKGLEATRMHALFVRQEW